MLARIRKAQENGEGGFTLIELLVVMIIIGILAAIAIPVFLNQRKSGYDAGAKSDVRNAATAEETYYTDYSAYTTDTTALPGWKQSGHTTAVTVALNGTHRPHHLPPPPSRATTSATTATPPTRVSTSASHLTAPDGARGCCRGPHLFSPEMARSDGQVVTSDTSIRPPDVV